MATTIPIPMPDSSRELLPALACPIDDRMEHEEKDVGAGQNRSSSLSEIEDRADEDIARSERNVPTIDSDSNDTEAETERLEDSPQKLRRNQNLVLTAANSVYDVSQSPSTQYESGTQGYRNYEISRS